MAATIAVGPDGGAFEIPVTETIYLLPDLARVTQPGATAISPEVIGTARLEVSYELSPEAARETDSPAIGWTTVLGAYDLQLVFDPVANTSPFDTAYYYVANGVQSHVEGWSQLKRSDGAPQFSEYGTRARVVFEDVRYPVQEAVDGAREFGFEISDYTLSPRFLVTGDFPNGLRSATWGGWIEEVRFDIGDADERDEDGGEGGSGEDDQRDDSGSGDADGGNSVGGGGGGRDGDLGGDSGGDTDGGNSVGGGGGGRDGDSGGDDRGGGDLPVDTIETRIGASLDALRANPGMNEVALDDAPPEFLEQIAQSSATFASGFIDGATAFSDGVGGLEQLSLIRSRLSPNVSVRVFAGADDIRELAAPTFKNVGSALSLVSASVNAYQTYRDTGSTEEAGATLARDLSISIISGAAGAFVRGGVATGFAAAVGSLGVVGATPVLLGAGLALGAGMAVSIGVETVLREASTPGTEFNSWLLDTIASEFLAPEPMASESLAPDTIAAESLAPMSAGAAALSTFGPSGTSPSPAPEPAWIYDVDNDVMLLSLEETNPALFAQTALAMGLTAEGGFIPPSQGVESGLSLNGLDEGETLEGGDGPDVITHRYGDDLVLGAGGDDRIEPGVSTLERLQDPTEDGDDTLIGGDGNDTLDGGDGEDLIFGGAGDDSIEGGDDADTIVGGGGSDTVTGSSFHFEGDTIVLTGGDDRIVVDAMFEPLVARVTALSEAGSYSITVLPEDRPVTSVFADTFTLVTGSSQAPVVSSDGPDVIIETIAPIFKLSEITDEELASFEFPFATDPSETSTDASAPDDGDTSSGETGVGDTGSGGAGGGAGGDDERSQPTENADILNGTSGPNDIDALGGDDSVIGGDGDDTVIGGDGEDTIKSGDGADEIDGGDGDDVILSGNDDDMVRGGAGDDNIKPGRGDDTVIGGDGDDVVAGFRGDERFEGGEGNDRLLGSVDDDTLIGGSGDDRLWGGPGFDVFVFEERDFGTDTLPLDMRVGSDVLDFTAVPGLTRSDFTIRQVGTNVSLRRRPSSRTVRRDRACPYGRPCGQFGFAARSGRGRSSSPLERRGEAADRGREHGRSAVGLGDGAPAWDIAVATQHVAEARARGAAGRRSRRGRGRRADLRAGGGRRRSAEAACAG